MAIKIVDTQPDIYLTTLEYNRHVREYHKMCMFMVDPPSFEEYVRSLTNKPSMDSGDAK